LKADADEYLNDLRLRNIITKYSDHLTIPIMMHKMTDDGAPMGEWETVNRATALWTLPKTTIKEEDYQAFYKHIAHDFEDALAWSHNKIEGGNIDYTSLIFIPKHAPFDMWQRDTPYGLKLYVQRVFIMDQVEQLLPHYLRFVRGVVDTNALPLNISREILQDHHTIPKLRAALVRHTLDLLDKLAKDEPEKYQIFWKEFGSVLKEGPAEDYVNRDRVAKLLRFSSTHDASGEQLVSLDDYIKRMKPNQKKIYYITADTLAAASSSPHLEIFKKNDIEVLLLTDRIDEWVVGHLPSYDEKPLQSAAKGDLALDELKGESDKEVEADKKKDEKDHQELDGLLKQVQGILADHVKEVKLSHRLTESPACLVRDQHALGPQMERLLKAAGQPVTEVKPILELNPDHAIVRKLAAGMAEDRLNEWTHILYEQALLAEGSALQDPASFVKRMNKLWMEIV
jgi:molecular chaperone HtpG